MSVYIDPTQEKNEETTKLRIITPIIESRWNKNQILMEYPFTDGRISIDEYNIAHRGKRKKADYLLLYKDNIPLAVVEAKGENHSAGEGYSQAVEYARILDVPFAYSTNGIELIEKDMLSGFNRKMDIKEFPSCEELWERYVKETNMTKQTEEMYVEPYYITSTGKRPRHYQRIAINRTVRAIEEGKKRLLIVMATGTGKTFTSFQIIYRYWHTRKLKKILYLADRNILIDQTMRKDFAPFMNAMEKIDNRNIHTSKDIFLGLYQQLRTAEEDYYKTLPRDFFDLIIVDECHRGSASESSSWRDILNYFSPAIQIGMTATPKDGGVLEIQTEIDTIKVQIEMAEKTGNIDEVVHLNKELAKAQEKLAKATSESSAYYFGNPIYTYSLREGIEDGFLAPYKVVSVELNIDKYGWRPPKGTVDTDGNLVEDKLYTQDDFDKKIVSPERRITVAKRISDFLKTNDMRYSKTIVFCEDIAHSQEMVRLLENENQDLVKEDSRYVMQITGDNDIGKRQLDSFIDPSSKYPVIAVTSRLMSTGVDAETCEVIVLDRKVGSMTEFKQIIGRGTRIKEKYQCDSEEKKKMYFTILDFRKNYLKFNDPNFDGDATTVIDVPEGGQFPVPPIKPSDTTPTIRVPNIPKKIARINGIQVEIVGEDVLYYDQNGNLVREPITSSLKNNIMSQYPTYEKFKKAWLLANDKARFASDLLLGVNWSESFRIRYGYTVDDFDIIAYYGYDIEPPMSKHQRILTPAVHSYLATFDKQKQEVAKLLLNAYSETNFTNLRDIKHIFSMREFDDIGWTPMKAVKEFGGKEKYIQFLNELENKLYETTYEDVYSTDTDERNS